MSRLKVINPEQIQTKISLWIQQAAAPSRCSSAEYDVVRRCGWSCAGKERVDGQISVRSDAVCSPALEKHIVLKHL